MKTTARILDIGRTEAGKAYIRLEIVGDVDTSLKDKDLDLDLKAHRERRSLNANAYFWHLVSQIAGKMSCSNNEIHNLMLSRYGYPEIVEGNMVYIPLKKELDPNKLEGIHLKSSGRITANSHGVEFVQYVLMRGSHTFNTSEMGHLIDGVISEAQELGIDTITPDEKARMMELYRSKNDVNNSRSA